MFNKYGYAPKGFLIDYHDKELLQEFIKAIKKYYAKKNFVFIKIPPKRDLCINYNINIEYKKTIFNNIVFNPLHKYYFS